MTSTNKTEHYSLSQYTDGDRPTYTGDYNSDMSKIDAAIYAASQSGGMAAVEHTADLTGDGTTDSPLGVTDTIARTKDIPSLDGYATTESVTQAIAAAIADRLTTGDIKAGNAISVSVSDNDVTISYTGENATNGNVPINTVSGTVANANDAYPALPRKVQVHGATSGVNTVEPTKLVAAGKNLIYGWDLGTLDSVTGNEVVEGSFEVRSSPSLVIPGMQYTLTVYKPSRLNKIRYYGLDGTYLGFNLVSDLTVQAVKRTVFTVPENVGSIRFVFTNTDTDKFTNMLPDMASVVQLEFGDKSTQWSLGEVVETNLPSDISLADGDTLVIDRDGTTRIVHAEGEPTVLENVTLPELPAPTFNVYTTGGYIQPTVDVNYEQDINIVINELKNNSDSSLSNRVTKLEQALNQPTPGATGLTAEQLDSQYSDGYNIIKVGTPTRSTETEESSK